MIEHERARESAQYATAGFTFAGTILVFGGVGYGLDHWLGTFPWLMLISLVLGSIGAFVQLVSTFSGPSRGSQPPRGSRT